MGSQECALFPAEVFARANLAAQARRKKTNLDSSEDFFPCHEQALSWLAPWGELRGLTALESRGRLVGQCDDLDPEIASALAAWEYPWLAEITGRLARPEHALAMLDDSCLPPNRGPNLNETAAQKLAQGESLTGIDTGDVDGGVF